MNACSGHVHERQECVHGNKWPLAQEANAAQPTEFCFCYLLRMLIFNMWECGTACDSVPTGSVRVKRPAIPNGTDDEEMKRKKWKEFVSIVYHFCHNCFILCVCVCWARSHYSTVSPRFQSWPFHYPILNDSFTKHASHDLLAWAICESVRRSVRLLLSVLEFREVSFSFRVCVWCLVLFCGFFALFLLPIFCLFRQYELAMLIEWHH